jgi:hypothetical protein
MLLPIVERLVDLIYLCKDGAFGGKRPKEHGRVIFNSLWQATDKEQAETRKLVAESDAIYINTSTLSPDEVAVSRFGGEQYSTETVIDASQRDPDGSDTNNNDDDESSSGDINGTPDDE